MATKITTGLLQSSAIANNHLKAGSIDTASIKTGAIKGKHMKGGADGAPSNTYIEANFTKLNLHRQDLANTNTYIATNFETERAALANTNLFIVDVQTKERAALANTNSYIASVQTAERAALANTNTYIATKLDTTTHNAALANTNTYIATKATDRLTTKGDLLVHSGSASARLSVGTDGQVLLANSNATEGVSWQDSPSGGSGGITMGKAIAAAIVFG